MIGPALMAVATWWLQAQKHAMDAKVAADAAVAAGLPPPAKDQSEDWVADLVIPAVVFGSAHAIWFCWQCIRALKLQRDEARASITIIVTKSATEREGAKLAVAAAAQAHDAKLLELAEEKAELRSELVAMSQKKKLAPTPQACIEELRPFVLAIRHQLSNPPRPDGYDAMWVQAKDQLMEDAVKIANRCMPSHILVHMFNPEQRQAREMSPIRDYRNNEQYLKLGRFAVGLHECISLYATENKIAIPDDCLIAINALEVVKANT